MNRHTAKDTHGIGGGFGARGAGLRLAVALGVWLTAAVAGAQDASAPAAGSGRYQPDRSRDDYAATADDGYDYAAETLRVSVWLDRDEDEIYRRGDEQRITFQTNQDAYAVVYRIDTEGLVTVLWPRDRLDDGFVFGGHEYRLPGREARALRIEDAEGEGYVEALVSRYPFDLRALELDFAGDDNGEPFAFRVAGDPFLAMNEVNYAVTGLEDSAAHVVANHVRYYVHRQVDHPRYLCAQCHDGDVDRYDPYESHCTLVIDYDYGWANRWYGRYGYYPVYWNPVWVYVDPWTWSPWVNFWYDPWYRCAPYYDWRSAYWGCRPWYDSPYYHGGSRDHWAAGDRRHAPLNRHGGAGAPRKDHEYPGVTRQVTATPLDPAARAAMLGRQALAGRAGQRAQDARGGGASLGARPVPRVADRFESTSTSGRGGVLRVRDGAAAAGSGARAGARGEAAVRRHVAAGGDAPARFAPVSPGSRRTDIGDRTSGARPVRRVDSPTRRDSEREGVRSLNPQTDGSRTWNGTTGRGDRPTDRGTRPDRPTRVRPERRDGADSGTQVRPVPRGGTRSGSRTDSDARPVRRDDSRAGTKDERAPAPAPEARPQREESPQQGPAASTRRDDSSSRPESQPAPSRSAPSRGTTPTRTRGGRG